MSFKHAYGRFLLVSPRGVGTAFRLLGRSVSIAYLFGGWRLLYSWDSFIAAVILTKVLIMLKRVLF